MNRDRWFWLSAVSLALALSACGENSDSGGPAALEIEAPEYVTAGANSRAGIKNPIGTSTYAWTIEGGTITSHAIGSSISFEAGEDGTIVLTCTERNEAGDETEEVKTVPVVPSSEKETAPVFPSSLPGEVATQIAVGYGHSCALTTEGGVRCWGYNADGQLGRGDTVDSLAPVDVFGLESDVVAITAGRYHTCALTAEGGVRCWGNNDQAQIGDGATTGSIVAAPTEVVGLASDVVAIASGSFHTCALTTAGGVRCWGNNGNGQLGDGATTGPVPAPVDVFGLESGVKAIAAGGSHSCAVTTEGGVLCWGANGYGQLGNGNTTDSAVPVEVSGLDGDVEAIAAGGGHTCVVTTEGGVRCWGWNFEGMLGDGTWTDSSVPVATSGLESGVKAITAGDVHTCALTTAGDVLCWGWNHEGQLGHAHRGARLEPVAVSWLAGGAAAVAAGDIHTCALTPAGDVLCWGNNWYGQLGAGDMTDYSVPVKGLANGVKAITAGDHHTCALTTEGGVRCWGYNWYGQLGNGIPEISRSAPVEVAGLSSGIVAVSAGRDHTCALTIEGGVLCWGRNENGRLGDGTAIDRSAPVEVAGLASGVVAIAAGDYHTCALTDERSLWCWGYNWYGQLGDGTMTDSPVPVEVAGLESDVTAITAGGVYTCALTTEGGVLCWGANWYGQLGDGTGIDSSAPVEVSGLESGVKAISAGDVHACAVTTVGEVLCWGVNLDADRDLRLEPVAESRLAGDAVAVAVGGLHTCVVTGEGGVLCWGYNGDGQLGPGSTRDVLDQDPVEVSGLRGVEAVAAGYQHTCALTTAGGVRCWGANWFGQLGDGAATW